MNPDSSDEMVDHMVDFFDHIAPVYDTWAGGQHGRVAARLVDLAAPAKDEQVLDVGTGTGLVAHLVASRVSPGLVIGIDLSANMLSIARAARAKNTQFVGMAKRAERRMTDLLQRILQRFDQGRNDDTHRRPEFSELSSRFLADFFVAIAQGRCEYTGCHLPLRRGGSHIVVEPVQR